MTAGSSRSCARSLERIEEHRLLQRLERLGDRPGPRRIRVEVELGQLKPGLGGLGVRTDQLAEQLLGFVEEPILVGEAGLGEEALDRGQSLRMLQRALERIAGEARLLPIAGRRQPVLGERELLIDRDRALERRAHVAVTAVAEQALALEIGRQRFGIGGELPRGRPLRGLLLFQLALEPELRVELIGERLQFALVSFDVGLR
jgi:hypothetical protein